jgi:predicted ArsR family transcriptional regulator
MTEPMTRHSPQRNQVLAQQGAARREALLAALAERPGATLQELADLVGLKSKSNVRQHLLILAQEGRAVCARSRWRVVI